MFLLLMSLCQTGAETIINSYEHVKLRTEAVAFPKSSKKYILINTTSKVNSKFTQNIYSMIKSIMFDERDYLIVMSLSLHIPHCSISVVPYLLAFGLKPIILKKCYLSGIPKSSRTNVKSGFF